MIQEPPLPRSNNENENVSQVNNSVNCTFFLHDNNEEFHF